jgi:hypothetical protein
VLIADNSPPRGELEMRLSRELISKRANFGPIRGREIKLIRIKSESDPALKKYQIIMMTVSQGTENMKKYQGTRDTTLPAPFISS